MPQTSNMNHFSPKRSAGFDPTMPCPCKRSEDSFPQALSSFRQFPVSHLASKSENSYIPNSQQPISFEFSSSSSKSETMLGDSWLSPMKTNFSEDSSAESSRSVSPSCSAAPPSTPVSLSTQQSRSNSPLSNSVSKNVSFIDQLSPASSSFSPSASSYASSTSSFSATPSKKPLIPLAPSTAAEWAAFNARFDAMLRESSLKDVLGFDPCELEEDERYEQKQIEANRHEHKHGERKEPYAYGGSNNQHIPSGLKSPLKSSVPEFVPRHHQQSMNHIRSQQRSPPPSSQSSPHFKHHSLQRQQQQHVLAGKMQPVVLPSQHLAQAAVAAPASAYVYHASEHSRCFYFPLPQDTPQRQQHQPVYSSLKAHQVYHQPPMHGNNGAYDMMMHTPSYHQHQYQNQMQAVRCM